MASKSESLLAGDSLGGDGGGAAPVSTKRGVPAGKPAIWADSPIPVGVCYAGCMFVCGNVLIGIGDALVEIATKNGIPMEDTGGLFLARGAGQILATLFCADLYSAYWGNGILMTCTLAVAVLWVLGALIEQAPVLYFWFFMTGLMTATLDIGTQILTRRAYGTEAGPWLTANTFCFATAGLLAPLVDYVTSSLLQQCTVYASFALVLALLTFSIAEDCYLFPTLMQLDDDASQKNLTLGQKVQQSLFSWLDPIYRNDAILALMIFFTIGGQNMMSNYLETYILITGVTPVTLDSLMLSLFWGSMVVSRLIAMFYLQPGLQTKPLISQMRIMFIGCAIGAVPLIMTPHLMGQDLQSDTISESTGKYIKITQVDPITNMPMPQPCSATNPPLVCGECTPDQCDGNCWMKCEATDVRYCDLAQPRLGKDLNDENVGGVEYEWSELCSPLDKDPDTGEQIPHHDYWQLFVGYLCYGFFVGPILGYIFDFHNRVTVSKERGSAILILGLNLGSSLVPGLFTVCLQLGMKGASMPVVELISVISPALLMLYIVSLNQDVVNRPPGEPPAPAPAPAPAPVPAPDAASDGDAPSGEGGSIYDKP